MKLTPPNDQELLVIASNAERYNGAGRDTVLELVAEIQRLRREISSEKKRVCRRMSACSDTESEGR